MDEYLADLSVAIDNVLDRWAVVKPIHIAVKYKLHVLSHIPDAVWQFGPSVLFATKIFECWNAVFRLCSVLSNHQAPSLDIATMLVHMERFKHQVSGGWWKPDDEDEWPQAGTVKRLSKAKRKSGPQWKEKIIEGLPQLSEMIWNDCKHAVAHSEDLCFVNSWVFLTEGVETIAGCIAKILVPESSILESSAVVIVEHFDISNSNDKHLDMPLLICTTKNYYVQPKDILFKFNVQHDCPHFSCPLVDVTGGNQEQQASKITRKMKAHSDDSRFHINLHALHNSHLVREMLPHHLTKQKLYFLNCKAKHSEFAAELQETGPQKWMQAQARSQATKLRNKQDKEDKATAAQDRNVAWTFLKYS
ncbi:hypothetical protein DFH08DRAFT_801782 [Mycena albidolilacea]|uniref:Uncharacterized protein n=1 Tax=Mycena albidolilacea TaxID=1033008 RepID=A0AAD7AFZ0_9AGAR|nr:hypothetical protein DFH08DRAFT_801782 [Mycena albidolilacea]